MALCALLAAGPTLAKGPQPAFDAKAETTLLSGATSWKTSDARRVWRSKHTLNDGQLRVRVKHADDMSLEVRFGESAITLQAKRLGFSRAGQPMAPTQRLWPHKKTKDYELIVLVVGEYVGARVFDARSGRLLGMGSARAAKQSGLISLEASASTARGVSLVSLRAACHRPPPLPTQLKRPLFVGVAPSDTRKLQKLFVRAVPGAAAIDKAKGRVFGLGMEHLERFHCDGGSPVSVAMYAPLYYTDGDYARYRDQGIQRDAGGPKLGLSFKSPAMVQALLKDWAARYPQLTRLEKLGTTHQGRPIWALGVGQLGRDGKSRPSIFVNGAHHGDEPTSVEFSLDYIAMLLDRGDPRAKGWLEAFDFWFVPVVNPDGLHAHLEVTTDAGRKNGRQTDKAPEQSWADGVDLNRNYPFRWGALGEKGSRSQPASYYYRGPSAGSEPETRAMMTLARREHFAASLTYHTGTVALLAPYTIDGVPNPKPNVAWAVAEELLTHLPKKLQGKKLRVRDKLYSVDGTDQDWLRASFGTLALLVEGSRRAPKTAAERRDRVEPLRPLLPRLLERFARGPSISGRVLDSQGQPVRAQVTIKEVKYAAGERWMTRCRDGRFDRFVTQPGTYTVVARAGKKSVSKRVRVGSKNQVISLILDGAPDDPACQ